MEAICSRTESRKRWSIRGGYVTVPLFEVEHLLDRVDELDRAERLQQVIGGADRAPFGLVGGLVVRAEHDDGYVPGQRITLERAADVEAVGLEAFERDIEQHQIGLRGPLELGERARVSGIDAALTLSGHRDPHDLLYV